LPQLPVVRDLDEAALVVTPPELQRLLAEEGSPDDEQRHDEKPPEREFVSVQVVDAYLAVRRVDVGIWRRPEVPGEDRLRIARGDVEDEEATKAMARSRFEAAGISGGGVRGRGGATGRSDRVRALPERPTFHTPKGARVPADPPPGRPTAGVYYSINCTRCTPRRPSQPEGWGKR
jgi:hypothetical protein